MKRKTILKIVVDIGMTVMLLFLMTYELIGAVAHEWLGIGMFVLFITHHILNRKWSQCVFKGRYTLFRIWQTTLVIGILLTMLGSMYSGVILSEHALSFLPIKGGRAFAREAHMISAYWGGCTDVASSWTTLEHDDGYGKAACKRTSSSGKEAASWECGPYRRVWRICFHTAGNRAVYAIEKSFCIF